MLGYYLPIENKKNPQKFILAAPFKVEIHICKKNYCLDDCVQQINVNKIKLNFPHELNYLNERSK